MRTTQDESPENDVAVSLMREAATFEAACDFLVLLILQIIVYQFSSLEAMYNNTANNSVIKIHLSLDT